MYIYHERINDLSAHMIHIIINLNTRFYTHVGPTKTIDVIYYVETHTCARARTHTDQQKLGIDISWAGNAVFSLALKECQG